MKAIVQARYGSPDVLQLRDINTPMLKDDEVLVRVHAAAVNIGDWHLLRGVPYAMRVVTGLRKPRREYRDSISPARSSQSAVTSGSCR
jgi:NADPH:quinone reductase-like Zn-dependent oxidoreductase